MGSNSIIRSIAGPSLFAALWLLAVLAMAALRDGAGAIILLCLPSAVAVATLHVTPRRHWPAYVAALVIARLAAVAVLDTSVIWALGYGLASGAEAVVATWLAQRAMGDERKVPETLQHYVGFFFAAASGALCSTAIGLAFSPVPDLQRVIWWFLSSMLGVLTGTPVALFLRYIAGFGNRQVYRLERGGQLTFDLLAMFVLAVFVMRVEAISLSPLLVVGVVAIATRHGYIGTSLGIMMCVIAATIDSIGGRSPAQFFDRPALEAGLWFQALMLLIFATCIPLAAMLKTRDRLEDRLRRRAGQLSEHLAILRLSEEVAGLGRWHVDLRTGRQTWSRAMLELNGLERSCGPHPEHPERLLPDRGRKLFAELAAHETDIEPFRFEMRVKPPDAPERYLCMAVLNQFDPEGVRIGLFGVAMDVTEQVRREEALDLARGRAVKLAAEAQVLANTDALTGLPNRRHTLQRLDQAVAEADRTTQPLSVVMFDIDHFKRINDTFGHQVGDAVLRRVASIARDIVRAGDLVGRVGGEEFVWLLPGVEREEACRLAERLRGAVEWGSAAGGLPGVTASLGFAHHQPGCRAEALLARADAALYDAKHGGRNRVRVAA